MLVDIKQAKYQISGDGILTVYDATRGKWLSAERSSYSFSINHVNATGPRYMRMAGMVPSNLGGYRLPRDATVTAISIMTRQAGTGQFQLNVIRTGTQVSLTSVALDAESTKDVKDLNIDILEGDALTAEQIEGTFDYPTLLVEVAWR